MEKSRAVATQPSSCEMSVHHEAASSAATLEAILLIGMLCKAGKSPIHPDFISLHCQPINELLLHFCLCFFHTNHRPVRLSNGPRQRLVRIGAHADMTREPRLATTGRGVESNPLTMSSASKPEPQVCKDSRSVSQAD